MKFVPLTRGYRAIVDDEDFERIMAAGSWCASVQSHDVYAIHGVKRNGKWTTERLHHFITGWNYVDHINGVGLDNRRANLRQADKFTNAANRGPTASNTSGFKGVTWHRAAGKWAAQLVYRKEHMYLGLFESIEEAARAHDRAAIEHWGDFAWTNFPREEYAA